MKRALRRLVLVGCGSLHTAQAWEADTLAQVAEFNLQGLPAASLLQALESAMECEWPCQGRCAG